MIGFITYVLHPLIWFIMRLLYQILYKLIPTSFSQVLCKWVPIYLLCSRTFFQVFINWYPCPLFSSSLWNYKLQIQLMKKSNLFKFPSNQPKFEVLAKLFFLNKFIANQSNWFNLTKFETLAWNQLCLGSFMEILE